MLPLSVLKCAVGHPVLVEVKSGETFNGNLQNVDNYMNIQLRDCICTSKEGDRFWRMAETFIRGNSIKFLRVPDELANIAKAEMERQSQEGGRFRNEASQRGSHGMRGGGGGGGGGGGVGRGRGAAPVRS